MSKLPTFRYKIITVFKVFCCIYYALLFFINKNNNKNKTSVASKSSEHTKMNVRVMQITNLYKTVKLVIGWMKTLRMVNINAI